MDCRLNEQHITSLEAIDPEIVNFYTDWTFMRESSEFETAANLLAHLAREILCSLEDRIPEKVEQVYAQIIERFHKFSHRHEGGRAPRPKEPFNQMWPIFENLLIHIIENSSDFQNTSNFCVFSNFHNSLVQLETELSESPENEWLIPDIELVSQQSEINENLQKIAPLLAAFYRDWLRMRQSTDFKCRSYLLAHLAREVDSGLRGALSTKQDHKRIQRQLRKENLGDLEASIGHIASIMAALGIDGFDSRVDEWIQTVKDLANLAHRDFDDEVRLLRSEVESLWPKVENLWAYLVGGYLNLLDRVDRILKYQDNPPTDNQIKEAIHNLIQFDTINKYFFEKLESPGWLEHLKTDGWFNPQNNPPPQEVPDRPGSYHVPRWEALEYVTRVADYTQEQSCGETLNTLLDIVNATVDNHINNEERIDNDRTDWQILRIIGALPVEHIDSRHIIFMRITLNSRWGGRLASQEIAQTILPKLIHNKKKDLTVELLKVIFDAKVVNGQIIAVREYWLKQAFKAHGEALAKLCGVEAAKIAIAVIRKLIADGAYSFAVIQMIEDRPSYTPSEDYAEFLVNFISMMFRLTCPNSITTTVADLLQEGITETSNDYAKRQWRTIVGLIALNAIKHHYVNLKQLFWGWKGNPLDLVYLKPGFYQLIEANCNAFNEEEIDIILDWIEAAKYYSDRTIIVALRKREWLTALLKTENEKVIAVYGKYKNINPAQIEHPGFNIRIETWAGSPSPITVEELSSISNEQIADYLITFREPEFVFRKSDPTEDGLAKTLKKLVAKAPQRFTDNLKPFQDVQNFYQNWILHGFLEAWRDKKEFDWAALLGFIHHVLLSERFWTEQHNANCNYRQWTLLTMADLIVEGTKNDDCAFDAQLLPIAEKILMVLVNKVEPRMPAPTDMSLHSISSNRGKVFSAMLNYALRFASLNDLEQGNRWPQTIKVDFTKRLDRGIESSIGFSYTLGFYLPHLSYLDYEWVVDNIDHIFPQNDEVHWQAAFSGYLYQSGIYEDLYSLLKTYGHYRKALSTDFSDEVLGRLVKHICIGWVQDWEILDDETSLIYQLINTHNPSFLSYMVYFFIEECESLGPSDEPEKVKAKVMPAWRALFQVLSDSSEAMAYQKVSCPLLGWLELVDNIDSEVLSWVKSTIEDIDKVPGYGRVLSRFFKALRKHAPKTPQLVGEIYLAIPQRVMRHLQTEEDEINETVRILYNAGHKETANQICNRFVKAGVDFLRSVYEEYRH